MTYRGYAARIEYSEQDGCFVGVRDIVGFHQESVAERRAAFEEVVDDYLAACEKLGQAPNKPYPGKVMLRLPPEVHAHAVMMAEPYGLSLNQSAAKVLADAD